MKFFVLSGSHRVESQSLKIANYVKTSLPAEVSGAEVFLYSLSGNPIPLWNEDVDGIAKDIWEPIAQELRAADAIVVVTPEWGGMATPSVKNFLLNCSADEIGHKPGLIVTVSAGRGGTYPVAELRMSGTKNNRLVWIPEQVIVQHAASNFNEPDHSANLTKEDAHIRSRLKYALRMLGRYGSALAVVRESNLKDQQAYPSGM